MSLEKYIGNENYESLKQRWQTSNSDNIKVTCIGSYNNGKSSLLNALIDDLENSTFKVSDNRETRLNKEVQKGNLIYVDTPGLNARIEDNEKVYQALQNSDLNLFVHNITTGELTKAEVDFLLYLKEKYPNNKDFLENIIFVLSQIDEMQDEENIKRTEEKIQEQIKNIFGSKAKILSLSSLRYIKGKNEGKNLLIKKSKLEDLKAELSKVTNNLKAVKKARQKKLLKFIEDYEDKLRKQIRENGELLKAAQREKEDRKVSLAMEISNIEANLANKYQQLRNI